MPRMLADDKIKFSILTTQPADAAAPTASELNGGIDASQLVSKEGWTFSAADSERVGEQALGSATNASVPGIGNYEASFTVWRQFLAGGGFDPAADAVFTAVKTKGSKVWIYARKTDKLASAAWAAGDEIFLGVEAIVDTPKSDQVAGYIRYQIVALVQNGYPFIAVAGSSGVPTVVSALPSAQTASKPLQIKGVRFTGTTGVTVGGVAATNLTVVDDLTLLVTMPAGSAGSAPIIVTNATGPSSSFSYTRGA